MLPLAVLPMMVMIDDAAVVLRVGDIVVGVAVACLAIGQVRPDAGHGRRLAGTRGRGAAGGGRTERRRAGRHGDRWPDAANATAQRQGGPFEKVHGCVCVCVRVLSH